MRKYLKYFKNKFVIAVLIIIIGVVCFILYRSTSKGPGFDAVEAKMGNVIETVSVTGVISPSSQADLAFQKGGVLSRVYVKVNDQVKRGQIIASLSAGNDRAVLASAEATLADMSRTLSPLELEVQKTALASAQASYEDAQKDALDAAHEGYVKAHGALTNYTDLFFAYPQSVSPRINLTTDSQTQETSINTKRIITTENLAKWSADLVSANISKEEVVKKSRQYLSVIKDFMRDLSGIVNSMNVGNSGLSQTQLDADKSAMNSGLTALDSAINTVSAAESNLVSKKSMLEEAKSSYNLKLAGNSSESIAAQAAKVAQAQAAVNDSLIVSPIDGVVTRADPNEGEFVGAGQAGFAVQNNNFKIEAYVPEADIAKLSIGNIASSTLDAYGADVDFPARVIMINPAETVKEGVPTYKVTLEFINNDERIRSGMTANLTVYSKEVKDTLMIPYRAIVDTDGVKTVRLVNPDGKTFSSAPVTTGLKGSNGFIQIISGLKTRDKVVIYLKQ